MIILNFSPFRSIFHEDESLSILEQSGDLPLLGNQGRGKSTALFVFLFERFLEMINWLMSVFIGYLILGNALLIILTVHLTAVCLFLMWEISIFLLTKWSIAILEVFEVLLENVAEFVSRLGKQLKWAQWLLN